MATNSYIVNGEIAKPIEGTVADIDLSIEQGVKAGCLQRPIPLLNKITVTSTEGALSKSTTIYAGYKTVNQMCGNLIASGNYNLNNQRLNTIITSGKFGIFEPAHYNYEFVRWDNYALDAKKISSLINVGTGIKICVKIEYTKSDGLPATAYVNISRASNDFKKDEDKEVPHYDDLGFWADLPTNECVNENLVDGATHRTFFESTLSASILDINLSSHIVEPKTTEAFTVTLMAYIGSTPTADNTFRILPMNTNSKTSLTVQFDTYDPTITIYNKDIDNNRDWYEDRYGSVADYNTGSNVDTTIGVVITPPAE